MIHMAKSKRRKDFSSLSLWFVQRRENNDDSSVLFSIRKRIIIEDRQGQKWIDLSLSICADLDEYFSPSCSSSTSYSDEGFLPSAISFRITKHIEKNILRERTDKQIFSLLSFISTNLQRWFFFVTSLLWLLLSSVQLSMVKQENLVTFVIQPSVPLSVKTIENNFLIFYRHFLFRLRTKIV